MIVSLAPVLTEWLALQVRRPRTRGFVMLGDPAVLAIVFGVIGLVSLIVGIRALSARSEQRKRLQQLDERLNALPPKIQDRLRDKLSRYREETLTQVSDPRQRNAALEQILTREVASAEENWHEELEQNRRRKQRRQQYAQINVLRANVRKSVRTAAGDADSKTPTPASVSHQRYSYWNRDRNAFIGAFVGMTGAAIRHLPPNRFDSLFIRIRALPHDLQQFVWDRMFVFSATLLHSSSTPEERGAAWERRFTGLLTEAEIRPPPELRRSHP